MTVSSITPVDTHKLSLVSNCVKIFTATRIFIAANDSPPPLLMPMPDRIFHRFAFFYITCNSDVFSAVSYLFKIVFLFTLCLSLQ